MELLTSCQTSKTRVAMRIVRRDTAGPGMELLTSCQINTMRVEITTVRRDIDGPNHVITYRLLSQQDQHSSKDGEKKTQLDLAWNCLQATKSTRPELQ